jgi:ABC-2 type transport system ATP-binding protein/lipopolysaccharide transport system ATP-binding protein
MEFPIVLQDVSVRYRLPKERIRSFKEFVIKSIKGRVEYEEFWALRHVNLQVPPGEVLGIVGRNGAGKTTLLKLVARVMKPISGQVRVSGKVAPMIELGGGFDPELTGRENVYLFGSILGISRRAMDQKFEAIAEFAELHDFMEAPLRAYSSGMVTRLGFAVVTAVDPEIMILDEVLAVGDTAFQEKCLSHIAKFRQAGGTILFVSHNLDQIVKFCDRAIWLDKGELRSWGATEAVVQDYKNLLEAFPSL